LPIEAPRSRIGLRDWWLLLPPLSIGVLTWAAFFYAGVSARRRDWLAWAGVYLGVLIAVFGIDAAVGEKDWSSTLAGLVLFALAGGGFAHAIAIRRPLYAASADSASEQYERAERRLAVREQGRMLARTEPSKARQLGVGRPDLPDAFDAELVDLNSAPATVIADVTGVAMTTAERVVAARSETSGFSSVEDLDLMVDLPPQELSRLRDAGVCVPLL
jgi:DNA uptake protein ComE-like DNA-binding protein